MSLIDEINAISDKVHGLEQQNTRLQNLVDSLTEQLENQAADEKVVRFLDMIEPDIEHKESIILNDKRLIEVIAAYRAIRPK